MLVVVIGVIATFAVTLPPQSMCHHCCRHRCCRRCRIATVVVFVTAVITVAVVVAAATTIAATAAAIITATAVNTATAVLLIVVCAAIATVIAICPCCPQSQHCIRFATATTTVSLDNHSILSRNGRHLRFRHAADISVSSHWSGFKLILLVGRMVDFLVKKRHAFVTVLKHKQASVPCRSQMDRW